MGDYEVKFGWNGFEIRGRNEDGYEDRRTYKDFADGYAFVNFYGSRRSIRRERKEEVYY